MAFPVGATFALNGGSTRALYVEQEKDPGIDWVNAYKASPAELRCRDQGEFCVEIAMDDDALIAGDNDVTIDVVDSDGRTTGAAMRFRWNPEPLPLPLDISDLSRFSDIQEVGQSVNGDFFAGLTEGVPPRGIKVGWNSAGMAALSPIDGARSFIAWGPFRRSTGMGDRHPSRQALCRRAQCSLPGAPAGRADARMRPCPLADMAGRHGRTRGAELPRHGAASFALFQHLGHGIEWSDIVIRACEPAAQETLCGDGTGSREPFLKRQRPGAF